MTQQTKDLRARVGYSVDANSISKVQEANKLVAGSFANAKVAATDFGKATVGFADTAVLANRRVAESIDRVTAAQRASNLASSAASRAQSVAGAAGGLLSTVGLGAAGSAVSSLLTLGASFGPLGLAVAGVTAVVGDATRAEEARTAALRASVDILKTQADLVAGGATTEDIQQQIANLEAGRQVLIDFLSPVLQARQRLQELVPDFFTGLSLSDAQMDEVEAIFESLYRLTGQRFEGINELTDYINGVIGSQNEYTNSIEKLDDAIGRGIFTVNDMRVAQEAAKEAEDARTKAINDAFQSLTAAEDKYQAAAARTRAAQEALSANTTKHNEKLSEIETDREANEREARRKAGIQAEEDERKHRQRLAEIEAQYALDRETAVGNRDALSLARATARYTADVGKENAAYKEQQRKLQENLDEQLRQYAEAAKKQRESELKAYEERQEQLVKALQEAQVAQSRADGERQAWQKRVNEAYLREQNQHNSRVENADKAANRRLEAEKDFHNRRVEEQNKLSHFKIANETAAHHANLVAGESAYWGAIAGVAATGRVQVVSEFTVMMHQLRAAIGILGGATGNGTGVGGIFPLSNQSTFNQMWDARNLQFQRAVNRR